MLGMWSRSLSCPLSHSLSHPLSRPLSHPLSHSLSHPLSRSLSCPLSRSLSHPLSRPLSRPLSHPLSHSLSSSLSHSLEPPGEKLSLPDILFVEPSPRTGFSCLRPSPKSIDRGLDLNKWPPYTLLLNTAFDWLTRVLWARKRQPRILGVTSPQKDHCVRIMILTTRNS